MKSTHSSATPTSRRWLAAIVVLLAMVAGGWYFTKRTPAARENPASATAPDPIAPPVKSLQPSRPVTIRRHPSPPTDRPAAPVTTAESRQRLMRLSRSLLDVADPQTAALPSSQAAFLAEARLTPAGLVVSLASGRTAQFAYLPSPSYPAAADTVALLSDPIEPDQGRLVILHDGSLLQITAAEYDAAATEAGLK